MPHAENKAFIVTTYNRCREEGGCYFFTVVTFNRMPLFAEERWRRHLHTAWKETAARWPFRLDAVCLMPDHLHCLWTLPDGDDNYSIRWSFLKGRFTRLFLPNGGRQGLRSASRVRKGEAAVWQRRFWEHTIRDDEDFNNHMNYIHYNPVKHGQVSRLTDWPWSTFHRYVREGYYDREWGSQEPVKGEEFFGRYE